MKYASQLNAMKTSNLNVVCDRCFDELHNQMKLRRIFPHIESTNSIEFGSGKYQLSRPILRNLTQIITAHCVNCDQMMNWNILR